jgi:parallel beta-helix repeat protein
MAVGVVRGSKVFVIILILIFLSFLGSQRRSEPVEESVRGEPETIIVDIKGNGDYTSIQSAIDNANPGGTIYVWTGVYYEVIIIDKPLSLIGNGSFNTVITRNKGFEIVSITSNNVSINGFSVTTNNNSSVGCKGISLVNIQFCNIKNINCSNSEWGIYLKNSNSNKIINNIFVNTKHGIYLSNSDSNINSNNTFKLCSFCITNSGSNSNSIFNNTFMLAKGNDISISYSFSNIVKNNKLDSGGISIFGDKITQWNTHTIDTTNNIKEKPIYYLKNKTSGIIPIDVSQIILANCSNIIIKNHEFSFTDNSINLGFSNNNLIENNNLILKDDYIKLAYSHSNNIINNCGGLELFESNNNTISNYSRNKNNGWFLSSYSHSNTYINNSINKGIFILACNSTKIIDNKFYSCGMRFYGISNYDWDSLFLLNNTVNGKPLYFFKNLTASEIPKDGGEYIFYNCSKIVVENQVFNDTSCGIIIGYSDNMTVKNNKFLKNREAIVVQNSESNKFKNNYFSNNKECIELIYSNNNIIKDNNCMNISAICIALADNSNFNIIKENKCDSSDISIFIRDSNHNEIINNSCNFNNDTGIFFYRSDSNIIINNSCNFNKKWGMSIYGSFNLIEKNSCSDNDEGIYCYGDLNDIINNVCSANQRNGVAIGGSSNLLDGNNFSKNEIGMSLNSISYNNRITNNLISLNLKYGILIGMECENNRIFFNQIFFNKGQVYDQGKNFWNNSFQKGNYWSDYKGVDNGANGRVKGDGIGDTKIPHLDVDNYPFVNPDIDSINGGSGGGNGSRGLWGDLSICRISSILLILIMLILFLILRRIFRRNK